MSKSKPNILWIMCDQLRFDYLSCAGHKTLNTPNIDWLAQQGVRFTNAYVQATMCGPSRMSAYTGRYVRSHGSTNNSIPLRVGEPTLGDHMREAGYRCTLIGKTHMEADVEGMERLGIAPDSIIGVYQSECGFEPYERDDGIYPIGYRNTEPKYNEFLRKNGCDGENPWEEWAASGTNGENGWLMVHADKPAKVPEELSETTYLTSRAIEFMQVAQAEGKPWCAHLSYIKPHWPYIAPAPYHNMFGPEDVAAVVRSEAELEMANPIFKAFTEERYSRNFSRNGAREKVIPTYMGLIKQVDDQLGRLFHWMEENGAMQNTMIVFCSDHGDYLGDHWMGEKYLFHEPSVKIPLIICDPSASADATRGTVSDALVEMIDLAPTFLEVVGADAKPHILEGRSLLPLLRDPDATWPREYVFSEYDFAPDAVRLKLDSSVQDSRMVMVFDGRFKLIETKGHRPMMYDLQTDPDELCDIGGQPEYEPTRQRLITAIHAWYQSGRNRITRKDSFFTGKDALLAKGGDLVLKRGVIIGYWDETELNAARAKLQG